MKKFERVEVGYIDTPLEKMNNLSEHFGDVELYIKRDDMTGLALGGNKTRKLDYIVKYALDNGYTTLLTYGAAQSNHGRLTIAAAAKFGLKGILVSDGKIPEQAQGNLILDRMMDGDVVFIDNENVENYPEHKAKVVKEMIAQLEAKGEKVLELPFGGSSPLGAYGYMQCIKEIIEQLKEKNLKIDYLFCGYGSLGTYAGLKLGALYYEADLEIVAVPVFPKPSSLEACVNLINELAEDLEISIRVKPEDLNVIGGMEDNIYAQPMYGKSSPESRQSMYLLAQKEAIITDAVYTGKILNAMLKNITKPEYKGKKVLFLHTGGAPSIFSTTFMDDIQDEIWNGKVIQK